MRMHLLCFALVTALLGSAGCGKYGKPIRKPMEPPPAATAEPANLRGLFSAY